MELPQRAQSNLSCWSLAIVVWCSVVDFVVLLAGWAGRQPGRQNAFPHDVSGDVRDPCRRPAGEDGINCKSGSVLVLMLVLVLT